LPFDKFVSAAQYDKDVVRSQHEELMSYSRDLHNYIRDYAKLSEAQKPLLVSGILIALRSGFFRSGYSEAKANDLPQNLFDAIKAEINNATMPKTKKEHVIQPYSFITAHNPLSQVIPGETQSPLQVIIGDIDRLVYPFVSIHNDFDVIGQFYAEFLRYAGGDASLGIVLTPKHIAELFVGIANLNKNSVVVDTCVGTGGFLISAMKDMCDKADNEDEQEEIKKNRLIGVENQPKMFSLAASNMILRGDGKANLYQGSCFDQSISAQVAKHSLL
jgi:type I restriction enzyme M protein